MADKIDDHIEREAIRNSLDYWRSRCRLAEKALLECDEKMYIGKYNDWWDFIKENEDG